jgi:NAD-dependent DNA ligase
MTIALGSEKIAEKLYLEIQKSKDADLSVLLAAFGIPLIKINVLKL